MVRPSRRLATLLLLVDAGLVLGAFLLAYWLRFRWGVLALTPVAAPPPLADYGRALAVALVVFLGVFWQRGLYRSLPPRGFDVIEQVLSALALAALLVFAATFYYRAFSYSRSVSILALGILVLALPLPRLAVLQRRRKAYRRGEGLVPALIVGTDERATSLLRRLEDHRRYGLDVRGLLAAGDATPRAGLPVLGTRADLDRVLSEHGIREVLVPDGLGRLELFELLEDCSRCGVRAHVVPRVYDLFVTPRDFSELYGVPFISVREERDDRLGLAFKRAFDLAVATPLLLLSLPLLGLLALLVRLESEGPAFFVQRRIGRNGVPFDMWKLRSMVADAPARLAEVVDLDALEQPVYKLHDDPRVTRLGRFLRRWSLDELPQLFNVVGGTMSLVGPRPETAEVVARYDAHQRRRLKAKPGLTGLQQIEARDSLDLDERIQLDVYYIRRRSFLFDLWILARTPWAVLHGRGAR